VEGHKVCVLHQGLGGLVGLKAKGTWAPSDLKAGFEGLGVGE
jgi:hypothetical protein